MMVPSWVQARQRPDASLVIALRWSNPGGPTREGVVTRGFVDPDDIAFLGHGKNRRLQRDRAKGQHQAQKQKGGNRVTCDGDYPLVFPGRGLKSPEIAMHDGLRCR